MPAFRSRPIPSFKFCKKAIGLWNVFSLSSSFSLSNWILRLQQLQLRRKAKAVAVSVCLLPIKLRNEFQFWFFSNNVSTAVIKSNKTLILKTILAKHLWFQAKIHTTQTVLFFFVFKISWIPAFFWEFHKIKLEFRTYLWWNKHDRKTDKKSSLLMIIYVKKKNAVTWMACTATPSWWFKIRPFLLLQADHNRKHVSASRFRASAKPFFKICENQAFKNLRIEIQKTFIKRRARKKTF